MQYETVIGIEIHCELKTKTKMFSSAPVTFGQPANSCTNEIDLGHPGVLPCLNKKAVELAIRACTATHCTIDPLVKFDRKNYYYSDLPKGFQITQQFHPIGRNGYVDITVDGEKKQIRLNRIHMEEDTAKQFHGYQGTSIDFNRAGTPLIEIVSEPDMRNGKEAAAYVEALRTSLLYMNVSDVKMEEGSMRCDVNVSIRPAGSDTFGTKTEIKNLNSISNVQKAIDAEVARQTEVLENGGTIVQATYRFDEATRSTVMMRKKEGTVDYKFFPEPNIPPVQLDEKWIASIQENLPELPSQRYERYTTVYGLSDYDANVLINNKEVSDFYDEVMKHTKEGKLVANWTISELMAILNRENTPLSDCKIKPEHLAAMVEMIAKKEISGKQAKELFPDVVKGEDPKKLADARGMKQVSDVSAILAIVNQVLDEQPQSIIDYKNGKDRAIGFLVGQIMKKSKGQANPQLANQLVLQEIAKR
ncbi:MAG: Asp-tRNA(Asn)/Glu-tRNA(Gln) amidotransferase subunit GatB [Erysipelotrichaceae bacterium]|nr:Asp-tRNA(Asn)/Glu-tRNA(Gln) amidotransferase subunit GatB [Erysipelotrichaceae bacterium]